MSSRAVYFLRNAEDAEQKAHEAKTEMERAAYETIAEGWRKLEQQAHETEARWVDGRRPSGAEDRLQ